MCKPHLPIHLQMTVPRPVEAFPTIIAAEDQNEKSFTCLQHKNFIKLKKKKQLKSLFHENFV